MTYLINLCERDLARSSLKDGCTGGDVALSYYPGGKEDGGGGGRKKTKSRRKRKEGEGEEGEEKGGGWRGRKRERLISLCKPRSRFPQTPPIIYSRPLIRGHRSGPMPIAPKLILHQEAELVAAADNGNSPSAARGEGPPPGPR